MFVVVERSLSICESSFDLQFSLSDTSDDENAANAKDKASNDRYLPLVSMCIRFPYFVISFGAYVSPQCLDCYNRR